MSSCIQQQLPVVPLWINGKPIFSTKAGTFPVYSSAQKKNVCLAQNADKELAIQALQSAEAAFASWKVSTAASRRDILNRVNRLLVEQRKELVAVQMEETSCSETWADFNITYATLTLAEIAARVTIACTGEVPPMSTPGAMGFVFKEAIGPVLLIAPWNGAVVLATKSLASILGAGCTVLFKASELCPKTHHLLTQLYTEAGVPPGVINVNQCRREDSPRVTEAIIAHRAVKKVEFIGSASVGRIIGSLCGKHLKPTLMELGGKCPTVILDDLNDEQLKEAVSKAIRYAFMHHGQVCFSCERIILLKGIANKAIEMLKKAALEFPPAQGVSTRIVHNAYDVVCDARDKGAKFIFGEPRYLNETTLAPALVMDVVPDMRIWDEESFGPSATVTIVESDEEAIKLVNEFSYGLDAFVHTKDLQRGLFMARSLEVGKVQVNRTEHEACFPFSAVKGSGWGSNNADAGMENFLVKKSVMIEM